MNQMKTPSAIWCVGRNFGDHAREMSAPIPKQPMIFLKAGACLIETTKVMIPSSSAQIDHEIELALQINDQLEPCLMALALDLTARDWQNEAKQNSLPWTQAKSFRGACPVSSWTPYLGDKWFHSLDLKLKVNGQVRQSGKVEDMIFAPRQLLEHLRKYFPLQAGDVVLTGTPAGVGPLRKGDQFAASCGDLLSWQGEVDVY